MVEDVGFDVELAHEAEGPVIELAAGSGRISIPIAERTGKRVIGIDLSPAMLELARERAAETGVELELHEADMHDLDVDATSTTYAPADNRVDFAIESVPVLSLWWVARSEWEGLLDVSGLETEALYGWFDRRPFDDSGREFVWIARKPAA